MKILTALLLATNDLSCGNADAAKRDFNGANYLIRIRGGSHNLGLGGIDALTLSGLDQYIAICYNTMPIYHMSLPGITLSASSCKTWMGRALGNIPSRSHPTLDPQLIQAGVNLTQLADIYEKGARNQSRKCRRIDIF